MSAMYTEFYDLKEKPFAQSPSSRFLFLGENHKEALALLTYGLRERKGFGLLTGEVGTGKTTIVHALLAGLDQNVHLVHLSNPLLSPREFLDYLARKALGRETPFLSKAEFLIDFEKFLLDCLDSGKNFLLIIDEAHKASFQLLEEIRLLSNMETAEEKLMSIFLVGQPELREHLTNPRCKALFQRITIHYHLTPLDRDSAGEYIRTRLRVAGARTPDKIFRESVIRKIHQYSKGYPREINNISDNLLLLAYAEGKQEITPEMVTECCRDMNIEIPPPKRREMRRLEEKREATPRPSPTRWKRLSFAIGFLGTIALVLAIGSLRTDMYSRSVGVKPQAGEEQRGVGEGPGEGILEEGDKNTSGEPLLSRLEGLVPAEEAGKSRDVPLQEPVGPPVPEHPATHTEAEREQGPPPLVDPEPPPERTSWQTVTVREGQTLRELALEAYGEADEAILAMLQEANPAIEDINRIEESQRITFPPLSLEGHESDGRVARHVPKPTDSEQPEPLADRDIYDRIDQDILRPLKERQPRAYRGFWEGLLYCEPGQRSTGPKNLASKEEAKERVSHFVRVASGIEREKGALRGTTGTLHPAALRAYSELSGLDPSTYAPLLKDSVIYREKYQGDVNLIHALDRPDRAEREEARKRFLLVIYDPDARLRELHTLGHYALETGWLEGAIAAFDRIVAEREPDYETYNNRAVAYLRAGKIELARNDLNRAIEKDPARPEAFNNMGMTYVHEKAYKDAATYFLHATKVDPSFHVSLLNAAVVYGQHLKNGAKATLFAREYLDRGGIFQRQMMIEWLGET